MKRFTTIIVLLGAAGTFFSGFVYWMANSTHQEAEQLRQRGRYCEVEVIGKHTSSPGDGSSDFYYLDIKPLDSANAPQPITCSVVLNTYEEVSVGLRLKAWVLGSDALLDYGPKNAASVARTMLITGTGFALVMIIGLALKVVKRGRS